MWHRFAALYGPLVLRWCRRAGVPDSAADDVLQEVFLVVATRISGVHDDQPGDTFRGWLWTVTRNKIGDWLQRMATREDHAAGTDQLVAPSPEDDSSDLGNIRDDRLALYREGLDRVRSEFTESTWQAFWQVVVEDRRPEDVAHDLGISRNAVYVARSRVLHRLRELLGEE